MIPLLLLLLSTPASAAPAPAAAAYGIVVDNSAGFRSSLDGAISAGRALVGASGPEDRAFVIRFVGGDNFELSQDFTSSRADLADALDNMYAEAGKPALLDAAALAAEHLGSPESLKKAPATKRALVLLASGDDRGSFVTAEKLIERLLATKTRVFAIGWPSDPKERKLLERLALETGGRAYFPASAEEAQKAAVDIVAAIKR